MKTQNIHDTLENHKQEALFKHIHCVYIKPNFLLHILEENA